MKSIKQVVSEAAHYTLSQRGGKKNACLSCVLWGESGRMPRAEYSSEVSELNRNLEAAGFDLAEIDAKSAEMGVVEHGGPIGLMGGRIRGCIMTSQLAEVLQVLEGEGKRRLVSPRPCVWSDNF